MSEQSPVKKKRTALWIGGGVFLLAVLLSAAAVMFPPAQYTFLRGARLRSIEVIDYKTLYGAMATPLPPGTPTSMTMKTYTSEAKFQEVVAAMRKELTSAKGWMDPMAGTGMPSPSGNDFAMFTHGTDGMVYAISNRADMDFAMGEIKGGKTIIMVMGETTFFDTVLDKVHRDETPSIYGGGTGGYTTGGGP